MVKGLLGLLFGGGKNVVAETAEVFRVNAEKSDARHTEFDTEVLNQYAAEFFERTNRTWADVLADALNRLVRPILALLIGVPIPLTIYSPETMAQAWASLATMPEQYWPLFGGVVTLYFGGRMHMKQIGFRTDLLRAAEAVKALVPEPVATIHEIITEEPSETVASAPSVALGDLPEYDPSGNAAIDDWKAVSQ